MLTELVEKYMEEYAPMLNEHISFYTNSDKDPAAIIHFLAFAIGEDHKTHPNQRRVSRNAKRHLEQYLQMNFTSIVCNPDFDETFLHLLEQPGIGVQTAYDTTKRIGLVPKKVYLHGGSLIGAKKLFSSLHQLEKLQDNNHVLDTSNFPKELQILSPLHIENFLCKFKTNL